MDEALSRLLAADDDQADEALAAVASALKDEDEEQPQHASTTTTTARQQHATHDHLKRLRRHLALGATLTRALALRALRRLLSRRPCSWDETLALKLDRHAARSLDRAPELTADERAEALQLAFCARGRSEALLMSVVAIAGEPSDPLRAECVECVRQAAVARPQLLSQSSGVLGALLDALVGAEPLAAERAATVALTLAALVDSSEGRIAMPLYPSAIHRIVAPLSAPEAATSAPDATTRSAAAAVVALGRTWAGLVVLAADPLCLRSLVAALALGPSSHAHAILGTLSALLMLPQLAHLVPPPHAELAEDPQSQDRHPPVASPTGGRSRSATAEGKSPRSRTLSDGASSSAAAAAASAATNSYSSVGGRLVDPVAVYRSATALALLHLGLLDSLEPLTVAQDVALAARARALLREMQALSLESVPLPPAYLVRLRQLPTLTTRLLDLNWRSGGSAAVAVDATARVAPPTESVRWWDPAKSPPNWDGASGPDGDVATAWHRVGEALQGASGAADIRLATIATASAASHGSSFGALSRMDLVMRADLLTLDDATLNSLLRETEILATKDHTRWDWPLIESLLKGPLSSMPRLAKVMSGTKWVKRQLSFLRPEKDGFHRMPRDEPRSRAALRAARVLVELMLNTEDAADYLGKCVVSKLALALERSCASLESLPRPASSSMVDERASPLGGGGGGGGGNSPSSAAPEPLRRTERTPSSQRQPTGDDDSDDDLAVTVDQLAAAGPILSEPSLRLTMSQEYFGIIGILIRSARGFALLERHKLTQVLDQMTREAAVAVRLDIVVAILDSVVVPAMLSSPSAAASSITVGVGGAQALAKSLSAICAAAAAPAVRRAAILHLGRLRAARADAFVDWGLDLLQALAADADASVRSLAVEQLLAASTEEACLEQLIQRNLSPQMLLQAQATAADHSAAAATAVTTTAGYALLVRFAERAEGLRQLKASGWLMRELASWASVQAVTYADSVEAAIDSVLARDAAQCLVRGIEVSPPPAAPLLPARTQLPPHLFGALGATRQGCTMLKESGALDGALATATNEAAEPRKRKGALWSLAHVASTEHGFSWVCDQHKHFVNDMTLLAGSSRHLSVRGTALIALSLLAASGEAARAQLVSHGWVTLTMPHLVVVLPTSRGKFFSMPAELSSASRRGSTRVALVPQPEAYLPTSHEATPSEPPELAALPTLIALVGSMASSVRQREVFQALLKLREEQHELFQQPETYAAVHELLARHPFRSRVRRFVHELVEGAARAVAGGGGGAQAA